MGYVTRGLGLAWLLLSYVINGPAGAKKTRAHKDLIAGQEQAPVAMAAAAPGDYQAGGVMDVPVTIPDTLTKPAAGVDLGTARVAGVRLPNNVEGTTMTFESHDVLTGTYEPVLKQDGTAYTLTFTAHTICYLTVDLVVFAAVRFVKPVCGTAQTGDTTINLVVRDY